MGQQNVLGAYPFHFHLIGTVQNNTSYLKSSAVFRSFYRGVSIHGTNGLLVQDNVAFHVYGNCYYLEAGVEEYNWLEHNFAGFVHPIGTPAGGYSQTGTLQIETTSRIQPADSAASGFYSGNPNNVWLRNAASGGFAGFSFPTLPLPVLDFRTKTDFIPLQRPLKQFEDNTAHSSGYFFLMAGGIYFGGQLWHNDTDEGKLYYSSGRYASDPRTENGTALSTHTLKNNKAWLAQWGVSHWGQRVTVDGWQAYDCVRGANMFGQAQLVNALIDGRSGNQWAQYPGSLADLAPIAGFQWYDNGVQTILNNVTFRNYFYQPELGNNRQSVFISMVHSDEFMPAHISSSVAIQYHMVDRQAIVNNPIKYTGSSRYFNWVDWDGSASLRMRPSVFGSYPDWWSSGDECTSIQPEWNVIVCDWKPWRTPGRLDINVPGYTIRQGSGTAATPTPDNVAGYVAQFGHSSKNRSVLFTRNEGTVGVTGIDGWYIHFRHGVPPKWDIYPNQIPPGTSIVLATRYPAGTTFSMTRNFEWRPYYSCSLRKAGSFQELLLDNTGELYWFTGKHLYMKLTDPDAMSNPPLRRGGATVWGVRFYDYKYTIEAHNLSQCTTVQGGSFCAMEDDPDTDIPDALPSSHKAWLEPYCADMPPPGNYTCEGIKEAGNCDAAFVTRPQGPDAQDLGSYCAVTCEKCTQWDFFCSDRAVPGGLSGGKNCSEMKANGLCAEWYMLDGNFCALTCQRCTPPGRSCGDVPPDNQYTCEQQASWGKCSESWM